MQRPNAISKQQPQIRMTDNQRIYLENIALWLKPPLLILVGIFVSFFVIMLALGLWKSVTSTYWLVVFVIFAFLFLGLTFYVSSYRRIRRDLREMILDYSEGIIRLSRMKYGDLIKVESHQLIIAKDTFRISKETYCQFKDMQLYRVYFTRHSKIFMFAEFDNSTGGVDIIHATA